MEIGRELVEEVAEASKKFCNEMEMTKEQRIAFQGLITKIVKYTITTSVDAANAVSIRRKIFKRW